MNPTYGQAALDLAVSRLRPYLDDALLADVTGAEQPVTDLGKDLVAEVGRSAQALRARLRCIQDYDVLSPSDKLWFDTATGILAAISQRGPALSQVNGGLTKRKAGDEEDTYAPPDPEEERRWLAELSEAVGFIGCVQSARVQIASTLNVINVSGRTRTRETYGRYSLSTILASLLPAGWGGDRRSLLYGYGGVEGTPASGNVVDAGNEIGVF